MDMLALLRTLGGLGVVLGFLAGALWLVRRYDLRLPGRTIGQRDRRLELIETLPIDGRRMVALVRRDGREHLMLIAPEGHVMLENAIMLDAADHAAEETRRAARADAIPSREGKRKWWRRGGAELLSGGPGSFAALVDQASAREGLSPPPPAFVKRVARQAASIGGKAWRVAKAMRKPTADAVSRSVTLAAVAARVSARVTASTTIKTARLIVAAARAIARARARASARATAAKAAKVAAAATAKATAAAIASTRAVLAAQTAAAAATAAQTAAAAATATIAAAAAAAASNPPPVAPQGSGPADRPAVNTPVALSPASLSLAAGPAQSRGSMRLHAPSENANPVPKRTRTRRRRRAHRENQVA